MANRSSRRFFSVIRPPAIRWAGEAVSIIGIVAACVFFYFSTEEQNIDFYQKALFYSILLLIFTDRFASFIIRMARTRELHNTLSGIDKDIVEAFNKVDDKLSDLDKSVHGTANCICIGNSWEAIDYLKRRIGYAQEVKDTFIIHGIDEHEMTQFLREVHQKLEPEISDFIANKEKLWINIYEESTFNVMEEFHGKIYDVSKKNNNYHVRTVKATVPIVNVTILEYSRLKSDREVLFGWGHHKNDRVGIVFSSKNDIIIDAFDRYFASIMSESVTPKIANKQGNTKDVAKEPSEK